MNKYILMPFLFLSFFFLRQEKLQNNKISASSEAYDYSFDNEYDTSKKPVTDTLSHIRENFIKKKDKYINKPLSVLLNDVNLKVVSYMIGIPDRDISVSDVTSISFLNLDKTMRRLDRNEVNKPAIINIVWKTPISIDSVEAVRAKSTNKGEWQAAEQDFYGRQIVGDIRMAE